MDCGRRRAGCECLGETGKGDQELARQTEALDLETKDQRLTYVETGAQEQED